MLNKLSRYIIILLIVIVTAIYLPNFYWMVFQKSVRSPGIYYSPTKNDFLYKQWNRLTGSKYYNSAGETISDREFRIALPFYYYGDLEKWGILPKKVKTFELDKKKLRAKSQMLRINQDEFHDPLIQLWPLIESQPKYSKLSMPNEFFRITDEVEFINPKTNTVIKEMTKNFTIAMVEKGFKFPYKYIFGNPTTRKPFDEGYFIVDNDNKTFHLKKVNGKPLCIKTPISKKLDIKRIFIGENNRKEFYGLLFTKTHDVYLITYDNYKLIKLPVKDYNSDEMKFIMLIDPLYRTINVTNNEKAISVVTDINYNVIDRFEIISTPKENTVIGKVEQAIFPFKIETYTRNSKYVNFDLETNYLLGIIGIILSLISFFAITRKTKTYYKENWFDIVIIALTGVYGLIAVLVIKPGYWD